MQITENQKEYWQKNLTITSILLGIWFVSSFVVTWFSEELNSLTFVGFPLGFYMSAQGCLIIYVLIIWYYQRYMNNLDIQYDVHEGDDE